MQLMIDISIETPAALRLAAAFLVDHAALLEAAAQEVRDATPTGRPAAPPPPPPSSVPAGTSTNVTPFPAPPAPPAPSAPSASAPPAPPAAPTPAPPSLPASSPTSAAGPDELDSAGVPWDARIHQKAKSKKKDNTWKLQKGIAETTVAAVMQELSAQGRIRAPGEGVPAAPSFPGSVPVPAVPSVPAASGLPAPGGATVPVPPVATNGGIPAPSVTFPGTGPAVPLPPSSVLGVPNTDNAGVVPQIGFRELVAKITAARGQNRVTAEEVSGLVAQAGAPNLQTLGAMAHLVPVVDQLLDVLLATR